MTLPGGRGFLLGAALIVAATALSTGACLLVVARLPADYFVNRRRPVSPWVQKIARNLLGVLLVAVGLVLSIPGVPGQGLLTIFAGLLLIDFPGKFRFERGLVSRPRVLSLLNRLRVRVGRPPLESPR